MAVLNENNWPNGLGTPCLAAEPHDKFAVSFRCPPARGLMFVM